MARTFARYALALFAVQVIAWCMPAGAADSVPNFSRDILPILSDNCFHCHGPDEKQRQGDLQLDTEAAALRTMDAVIVPGKSGDSKLYQRIISANPDEQMPPPKSNRKLTKEQIELLKRWIDSGSSSLLISSQTQPTPLTSRIDWISSRG